MKKDIQKNKKTEKNQIHDLVEKAKAQEVLTISQLGNRSSQTFIMTRLFEELPGNFAWIVKDEKEARAMEALCAFWLNGTSVGLFRLTTATPELYARIQEKQKTVIIINLDLLRNAYPDRSSYVKSCEHLEIGERRSPIELSQRLIQHGYSFTKEADVSGTFARRGGILDVYPVNKSGVTRIEFSDNAVQSIEDVSGKKALKVQRVLIPPARLTKGSVSFWSIWPEKPTIVYEDPEGDDHPLWQDVVKRDGLKKIVIHPFKTTTSDVMGAHTVPLFHNDLKAAIEFCKQKKKEGWHITFFETGMTNRLKGFVHKALKWDHKINGGPENLDGFSLALSKEAVITDKEIFGKEVTEKREANILDQAFLSKLEEGDFVVHADHGVGKFIGMQTNTIENVSREYFVLEYAEQDKLYVPVENADKLTKYLGSEMPKLHRLSGSSWNAITRKIKDEARVLAKELLQLYAKRSITQAPACGAETPIEQTLRTTFPYQETTDQMQAIQEVTSDMQKTKPMDRLICGDVGFGKTEVAIRAACKAAANGLQVALLSPTTILTQQHYDTFKERLKGFDFEIGILSRFETRQQQDEVIAKMRTGEVKIVIGTHRLLSPDVKFKKLGLVIIDEEQRFGVKHKEQLKRLRTESHVLTLTATPIPRTLNIALSGIRDISLIETPPEGRLPIETIIEPYSDSLVQEAIRREYARGGQVYYLYNNVETIELASKRLQKITPESKIGIAHGQLDEETLSKVMSSFDTGKANLLVCSTIIENGLDLPNVNTIIVENATKFGLAQLYQLRGRVGRGLRQAYAYFLYGSAKLTGMAKRRLQSLLEARELGSGFQLALRDLEIRGVGNILGREQHGKVSAVGLALYSRLLSQAVEEIKTGKPSGEFRDILIDLPISIGIPTTYIPKEANRLRLYQKIAEITRVAALQEAFGDMKEAYGNPPQEVKNLFALLKLRSNAQLTDISRIEVKNSAQGQKLFITFAPTINPKMIPSLLETSDSWTFSQEQIRINLAQLGTDWFKGLEQVIDIAKGFKLEQKLVKKAEQE